MRQIAFLLNGNPVCLTDPPPTRTLLDWLRDSRGLCGTKEGCNEGDCGACTVMVTDARGSRALNACILFLPQLHGKAVRTVEGLAGPDGALRWMTGAPLATMLGLVALTMVVIQFLPRFTRAVPASLAAIVGVTLLTLALDLDTPSILDSLRAMTGDAEASLAGGLPSFGGADRRQPRRALELWVFLGRGGGRGVVSRGDRRLDGGHGFIQAFGGRQGARRGGIARLLRTLGRRFRGG